MDTSHLTENVRRLRGDRGLSQEQVAAGAGISLAAYRALEKGRSTPRPETLRAVARVLRAPLREILAPSPRLEHVRFRSLKRLKSRDQVLVEVARWLRTFAELEEMLGDRRPHALGAIWSELESGARDPVRAAARVRVAFGVGAREPIHDICGLLEARGVKVRAIQVANDAFLGLSVAEDHGGPAVVVNTWDRLAVEHWIYSAAHELGHLVLHRPAYDAAVSDEDVDEEREAEAFASHFLMPESVFRSEWEEASGLGLYDRVMKVKRVFRVSWRTVVFRVSERFDAAGRKELWLRMSVEHHRRTGRHLKKLDEPSGVEGDVFRAPTAGAEPAAMEVHDFRGDRLSLLVRRAVEGELITLARGAEILGLGVSEMRDLAASWVA